MTSSAAPQRCLVLITVYSLQVLRAVREISKVDMVVTDAKPPRLWLAEAVAHSVHQKVGHNLLASL